MRMAAMAVACAFIAACGGEGDTVDDAGLHTAIAQGRSGVEVTGIVTLLAEPQESGGHERMRVRDQAGDRLEIDHNTTLAERVPAHSGDTATVHGQLYLDPGGAGIHCTHARTSRGCPAPGWIEFRGHRYA